MAAINKLLVGESVVVEGSEVAHIDLLIGPKAAAVVANCNDVKRPFGAN